jgi:acetyltransferase-like isoleucine patch superfamily enzyme
MFSEGVKMYDHNHLYLDKSISIKEQGYTFAPIVIGRHCWIASNVIILKGVNIGDNCTIRTGCIIYKNIPDNSIAINKQNLTMKII